MQFSTVVYILFVILVASGVKPQNFIPCRHNINAFMYRLPGTVMARLQTVHKSESHTGRIQDAVVFLVLEGTR